MQEASEGGPKVLPPQELFEDLGSILHSLIQHPAELLTVEKLLALLENRCYQTQPKPTSFTNNCRFVINSPEEELQSFERLLFLVEEAHWFYEDNVREQNPSLKCLTLREFTSLMFQHCHSLQPYIQHVDNIYKDFTTYKVLVPTVGAIILDRTFEKVLMVKGCKGSSWGFPKGKKSKDEPDPVCAVREVEEEVGIDIKPLLNMDLFVEVEIGQQRSRLYVVAVDESNTSFKPQTRGEISEIGWHRLEDLPASSDAPAQNRGLNGAKYYMVWPFVSQLRKIVQKLPGAQPLRKGRVPGTPIQTVWKVPSMQSNGKQVAAVAQEVVKISSRAPVAQLTPGNGLIQATPMPSKKVSFPLRAFKFDVEEILRRLDLSMQRGK